MTATARDRRDRLRAMLADLKMPGALEAVDGVLAKVDSGAVTAGEAIEQVLGAQIALRYIVVSHAHDDRYFGASVLQKAYPSARVVMSEADWDVVAQDNNPPNSSPSRTWWWPTARN